MAMELLFKTAIAVIIVVAAIAAAYLLIVWSGHGSTGLTEAQAVSLIQSDLKEHYSAGDITVLNASLSQAHQGSWDIVTRIVFAQGTPCPSIMTEAFDYPATGLLNATEVYSNYSEGVCHVYAGPSSGSGLPGIVGLPAMAIATPVNESFGPLMAFIASHGFGNVQAQAGQIMYSDSMNVSALGRSNSTPANFSPAWLVNYTSGGSTFHVILSTSGQVLYNYTT